MLRSGTHLLAALFVALPAAAEPDCGIETLGWASVGHPGNPPDAEVMLDDTSGYGAVDHLFEIQLFEVTNAQYVAFLSAVASSDPHALYAADMAIFGGIDRSGSPGGYAYEVRAGLACEPVNFVSWYNALRFANWMHNGQPVGAQGPATTEDGAYRFEAPTAVGPRQPAARVFLPSEDEWYKAAYYDAASGAYHDYPTGTNVPSVCARAPDTVPNTANCYHPYQAVPAAVGSYSASRSPHGTFDQGGNLHEWVEQALINGKAVARGGSYTKLEWELASNARNFSRPQARAAWGFRLARRPPERCRWRPGTRRWGQARSGRAELVPRPWLRSRLCRGLETWPKRQGARPLDFPHAVPGRAGRRARKRGGPRALPVASRGAAALRVRRPHAPHR